MGTTKAQSRTAWPTPEEVRHASRNADSACPFLPSRQYKKGHAESAFRDACRTSSGPTPSGHPLSTFSGKH